MFKASNNRNALAVRKHLAASFLSFLLCSFLLWTIIVRKHKVINLLCMKVLIQHNFKLLLLQLGPCIEVISFKLVTNLDQQRGF